MSYIRSRKHDAPGALKSTLAVAVAALAVPVVAMAADEPTLATVNVTAETQAYKAERVASPKFTEALVNTPQTIQVITEQLAREQGATTLTEALRNSPGVGTFFLGENGNTQTGDAVYMRGFDSSGSIYVDGIRDLGSISRDIFNIEQIEVIKGPAGTDYGRSAPTGAINLATKRAGLKDAVSGGVTLGEDYGRATVDLNQSLGEETALRLNVMGQKGDVAGRDEVENERWGVAGSLGFGLKSATRAWLDVLHMDQSNVPDGGVPTIGLPGYTSPDPARPWLSGANKVDPKNFYGTTSDYDDVKADMVTLTLEHDFSPTTTLRNSTRYGKTEQDYLLTAFMVTTANLVTPDQNDPSTWTLARSTPTFKNQENEILTNQTNLSTSFRTGRLQHSVSTGLELTREEQLTRSYSTTGSWTPANLYNPDPHAVGLTWRQNGAGTEGKTDTAAVYLFDTIKFNEQWQVNAGVRYEHFNTEYASTAVCTHPAATYTGARGQVNCGASPVGSIVSTADLDTSDNLFSWKLGVVYKPAANGSVYVNYATSKQPPGGANFQLSSAANSANNIDYKPQEARTSEIGTKWDLLNQRLALTAALYRTEVLNEVEQDPVVTTEYHQNGEKRVKGIELSAVGRITDNWNVSAGYALTDTKVVDGKAVGNTGSTSLNYTPKDTFTAWTTYNLGHGFTIGGGARYVDGLQRGTDGAVGTPKYTESYWVFDAVATYAISKNLNVQLNVYNLLDEEYVAAINKSGYRYTPGTPRTARVGLNFTF